MTDEIAVHHVVKVDQVVGVFLRTRAALFLNFVTGVGELMARQLTRALLETLLRHLLQQKLS